MNTLRIDELPGVHELALEDQQLTGSGGALAPLLWGAGVYLAKECADNWGEVKKGLVEGFQAVWGKR